MTDSVSINRVTTAADRLRDVIFRSPPGERIGSLADLTAMLGVGTVTVQQAVRVLEHEGLIAARRGPGGGFYGARPDERALERALSAYFRTRPATFGEALDITSLLFNELAAAAAGCADAALEAKLRLLLDGLPQRQGREDWGAFEEAFQALLFRMVDRPLFELITRVTLQSARDHRDHVLPVDAAGEAEWRAGRQRIIAAILAHDAPLARFEAQRSNRQVVMAERSLPSSMVDDHLERPEI